MLKWLKITPKPHLRGKNVWSERQGLQGEELSIPVQWYGWWKGLAHDPQERQILGEVSQLAAG